MVRKGEEKRRNLGRDGKEASHCRLLSGGGTCWREQELGWEETAGKGAGRGGRKEKRHMGIFSPMPDCFSSFIMSIREPITMSSEVAAPSSMPLLCPDPPLTLTIDC